MVVTDVVEQIGKVVDFSGVVIMVGGATAILLLGAAKAVRTRALDEAYEGVRHGVGRSILLGLEVLIVGDIINTVAVKPTFRSVGVLAVIVLIRTFLSITLDLEITGRWPWQPAPAPSGSSTPDPTLRST